MASDPAYSPDQYSGPCLPFSPDIVQVWRINLDVPDWRYCISQLSSDERQRAARFVFERDRRRFTVTRTALRTLLGCYVQAPPSSIHFSVTQYGKPQLIGEEHSVAVCFNVSHSHELALIAVSGDRELGIDVEWIRPLDGIDDISVRHFAPTERLAVRRAAPAERLAIFYRYWTLKEAYLKGEGVGIQIPLDQVDVSAAGDDPIVLPARLPRGERTGWSAQTLDPGPGYAAALVVEGLGRYSVAMVDFVSRDRTSRLPLTTTDAPHTVGTSVSADG